MRTQALISLGILAVLGLAISLSFRYAGNRTSEIYQIGVEDTGKGFEYPEASRFMITLDQTRHPLNAFTVSCEPETALARISNIPGKKPPFYAARFEGVAPGTCTIRNNDFQVTVRIVSGS